METLKHMKEFPSSCGPVQLVHDACCPAPCCPPHSPPSSLLHISSNFLIRCYSKYTSFFQLSESGSSFPRAALYFVSWSSVLPYFLLTVTAGSCTSVLVLCNPTLMVQDLHKWEVQSSLTSADCGKGFCWCFIMLSWKRSVHPFCAEWCGCSAKL